MVRESLNQTEKSHTDLNHRNQRVIAVRDDKFIFNNMIKNEKVFELRIDDEDELSGIDSISLVDEPAIEVNWVAFNKEKPHEFHIPDGEDDKYIEKLVSVAQDEQELFDEGWIVNKIQIVGENEFISTDPNGPSEEDEEEYNVRYKYILNPKISQNPIIKTTRDFCKTLINRNYVWRIEDMEKTQNDFGDSAMVWRGGFNCRHVWARIEYKKDATIVNKASVNKGKVTVGGFPTDMVPDTRVLGYDQPDTVTSKTLANPSPSTVKNLGLSKVSKFEYLNPLPSYVDEVSGDTISKSLVTLESHSDYPDSVKNNAKAVLKYVEENGWGSCGTGVGKQRANQLANGEPISEDTIRRMYSYLSRHEVDLDSSKGYGDGCGKLMYDSWGGKSALSWAEAKIKSIDKEKMSKQRFATDDEQRTVIGPAMIADQKIFRKDVKGNPYYVYFSSETIKMIAEKYMRNKYTDNNDLMHDGKAVRDVYVVESWIKETEEDKSTAYGYESIPVGSWFIRMKVAKTPTGDKVWEKIKGGFLNGFSVSGYFEEVAEFCKEEMFLRQVAEILKNIKD